MKKKLVFIAVLTILLAFNFISCGEDEDADDGDDGVPKTLVITGISGDEFMGDVYVALCPDFNTDSSFVAFNGVKLSSGSTLTIPLMSNKREGEQYTGTGSYYIILIFEGPTTDNGDDIDYIYSAGAEMPLKYNFKDAKTTIAFDQFKKLE